jgi:hypothetical protein
MENKKKPTRTTDEDITLRLTREQNTAKPIQTTDEEITVQFMYEGDRVTRHPKYYDEIEY